MSNGIVSGTMSFRRGPSCGKNLAGNDVDHGRFSGSTAFASSIHHHLSSTTTHIVVQPFDVVFDHQQQKPSSLCHNVEGNFNFMNMISNYKDRYLRSTYSDRKKIAQIIVNGIRLQGPPPGRFIERRVNGGLHVMSEIQALARTFYFLEDNILSSMGTATRQGASSADAAASSANTETNTSASLVGTVRSDASFSSYMSMSSPGSAVSAPELQQVTPDPVHNLPIEPDPIPMAHTVGAALSSNKRNTNNLPLDIMSYLEPTPIDESLLPTMHSSKVLNGVDTGVTSYIRTSQIKLKFRGPIDPFDRSFLNVEEWDLDMQAIEDDGEDEIGNAFNIADIDW